MSSCRWRYAPLLAACASLAACGGGEIPAEQILDARILDAQPATHRETGKPVNGTVVVRDRAGKPLGSMEYRAGFPTGAIKEWFPNGQLKTERHVKFDQQGKSGRLRAVGKARTWCENGTLNSESTHAADSEPKGEHKRWNCDGQLLELRTYPTGPVRQWVERPDGSLVLVEEGTLAKGGGWQGDRKRYHPNGRLAQIERWRDGQLDGEFERWDEDGKLIESGRHRGGKKIGLWMNAAYASTLYRDYDADNFNEAQYTQAFMRAAGISPVRGYRRSALQNLRFDRAKIDYYVGQGLIDLNKKVNLESRAQSTGREFSSSRWTYPIIRATPDAAELLVALGADPKALDSEQRSRLHHCIYSLSDPSLCSASDIERLLMRGVSANQQDIQGNTPLHELMRWDRARDGSRSYARTRPTTDADLAPILELLLEAGADTDIQNSEGLSALMLATRLKRFRVAEVLLDRSANPQARDEDGLNLIHLAFQESHGGRRFLLGADRATRAFVIKAAGKGIDPMQSIGDGESLKTLAERNGAIEFAQFLVSLKPT